MSGEATKMFLSSKRRRDQTVKKVTRPDTDDFDPWSVWVYIRCVYIQSKKQCKRINSREERCIHHRLQDKQTIFSRLFQELIPQKRYLISFLSIWPTVLSLVYSFPSWYSTVQGIHALSFLSNFIPWKSLQFFILIVDAKWLSSCSCFQKEMCVNDCDSGEIETEIANCPSRSDHSLTPHWISQLYCRDDLHRRLSRVNRCSKRRESFHGNVSLDQHD